MSTVLLILIGGLTKASIFFLIAAGLTLVFGVGKIINFAHGSFYVLAMYLTYSFSVDLFGGSSYGFWLALVLTPLSLAAVGLLVEYLLLRRVYGKEHLIQLLLTFGLVFVFQDVYRMGWGVMPKIVPQIDLFGGSIDVLGTLMPTFNLFIIACSLVVFFILLAMLSNTRFGRLSRAIAFDGDMAELLGVNVNLIYSGIFALGSLLAGIGGVLATQLSAVNLGMDTHITILAFIMVIVGGVGSVTGAAAAGIIIGMVEAFGSLFLSQFVLVLIYLVMVIVLLFRPFGLFGKPVL
ncbi:MAG: branched-chain amino acid ABC transporter permease [Thermodesulfobacteriota bacterium]